MAERRPALGRLAGLWIACVLLSPAIVLAARPDRDAPDHDRGEPADRVEKDDPRERARAMEEWRGPQNPAARMRILEEAARERQRSTAAAAEAAARSPYAVADPATLFMNLGPTRASREYNGGNYFESDSGRARQIVTHPTDPNILYMATSGGGVWKTYDQGASWEPITDQLGTLSIGTLAMDPGNPDDLYLGYGDPFDVQQPGIVRSLDGGLTWLDTDPPRVPPPTTWNNGTLTLTAQSVRDLKVDPTGGSTLLVATNAGLFRSTDSGLSYQQVTLPAPNPPIAGTIYPEVWSIAWAGPNTWLATGEGVAPPTASGQGQLGGMGIWRSIDNGATWDWAPNGLPFAQLGRTTLAAALSTTYDANTARLYLLAAAADGSSQADVYRSEDGGQSWAPLGVNGSGRPQNPTPFQPDLDVMRQQAFYNQAILVDPVFPDTVFIGGQFSMIRSLDGGITWAVLSDWLPPQRLPVAYVHADFHAFALGADGTFFAGTDGGINRSPGNDSSGTRQGVAANGARAAPYQAVTFTSTTNIGLATHLAYSVVCASPGWPAGLQDWVGGGMQDNGTRARIGHSTTFDQVLGGDGFGIAVSGTAGAAGPDVFLSSVFGGIRASNDAGASWRPYENGLSPGVVPQIPRMVREVAPSSDPAVFLTYTSPGLAGTIGIFKSQGASLPGWQNVSGTLRWPDGTTYVNGFKGLNNTAIGMRKLGTHLTTPGVWGGVSNRYAYATGDGGANWYASTAPAPGNDPIMNGGAWLLSSIEFDPDDVSGNTYYVTSKAMDLVNVVDANGTVNGTRPMPESFGHLYLHEIVAGPQPHKWTPVGANLALPKSQRLPFVPINVVKFDPGDATHQTMFAATEIGLYRSLDKGATWSRYGGGLDRAHPLGLPLVEVTDLCISGDRLFAATFGRGFWQISTDVGRLSSGVHGLGDTNFDGVVDGRDLLDLADSFGATRASGSYRPQADLGGPAGQDADLQIDDTDLQLLLQKLGGRP